MGFDVQVHTKSIVTLIENLVQEGFRTRCLPSADDYFVDHVDVVSGTTAVNTTGAGVDFVVKLNVFVVQSSAVLAAPNGVPAGATSPIGQATITLQLSISSTTTVTMSCTNVDLGVIAVALGSSATTVQNQIQGAIGTVGTIDVGTMAATIGLPVPSSSSVGIVGTSVLLRFDPTGPGLERLQSGQDWCLFVDANTMVQLVKTKLSAAIKALGSEITSATIGAAWTPTGTTPEVSVSATGKAQVPDPFSGDVFVELLVVFGLLHTFIVNDGTSADLTMDVTWHLSVDLGWFFDLLVPPFVTQIVVTAITSSLNPATFGATALGPHKFELLAPLPHLGFGGATFDYGTVVGLQAGMVLGGAVTIPPNPGTGTLSLSQTTFPNSFTMFVDCSKGSLSVEPTLATVIASASAWFSDAGKICDIHFVSPASPPISLAPYLTAPADGTVVESGTIAVTLPGTAALALSKDPQPIQLWVQSARGVRLLDLGAPPVPQLDDHGDVTNYHLVVIDDCPRAVDPWWRVFHMFNPKWSVDPPESWTEALDQVDRFETILVEVNNLSAGSLVRFDMPIMGFGAGSVFSADESGRVMVPAVLTARSDDEGARLSTIDRQELGEVVESTAVFERIAVLDTPGALSHDLVEATGAALVTSRFAGGRSQTVRIDGMRIPKVLDADQDGADPIEPGSEVGDDVEPDLPGLVGFHPVPGFESEGVRVAELDDGTHLAVVERSGRLRAVGTLAAWPHMPRAGKTWAISASTGDRVAVFAVSRTLPGREASTAARKVSSADCGCPKASHDHRPGHDAEPERS
jgi:hypothetical protein